MSRKLLLVLSAGALAAAGLFTSGAAKATTAASSGGPGGGMCQLAGNAYFTPGLTANSQNFSYTFSGALTGCQSNNGAPTSGSVSTAVPATGTGSCSSSTTKGYSVSTWADSKQTVVQYTTTGAGALVVLQGTVVASVTLNGQTFSTSEPSTPAGSSAFGELTFSTSSPTGVTACNTKAGLPSAVIGGFIEIGQS